ncbi:MAG: adenine phosphoribosyltransferase [Nanoarchaeota archaeon]
MNTIKSKIRTIPDFPKQGIQFRDITTLLQDPEGLAAVTKALLARYSSKRLDVVVGIESRGFVMAAILAERLGLGFVPARKKGKLPYTTESQTYDLEYGTDTVEMHVDSIAKGMKALIVDDLVATGGTALAVCQLVEKLGGEVMEVSFIVDLPDLGGRKKIEAKGYKTHALVQFEGE